MLKVLNKLMNEGSNLGHIFRAFITSGLLNVAKHLNDHCIEMGI
jgi:hypothetical protein